MYRVLQLSTEKFFNLKINAGNKTKLSNLDTDQIHTETTSLKPPAYCCLGPPHAAIHAMVSGTMTSAFHLLGAVALCYMNFSSLTKTLTICSKRVFYINKFID